MSLDQLDRRTLLKWLATLSFGLAAPALLAQEAADNPLAGLDGASLKAVQDLGKRYETDNPSDREGIDRMAETLRKTNLSDDALVAELREQMRADYAAERAANLYGWFISRTEARVLAAIARLAR